LTENRLPPLTAAHPNLDFQNPNIFGALLPTLNFPPTSTTSISYVTTSRRKQIHMELPLAGFESPIRFTVPIQRFTFTHTSFFHTHQCFLH
ncbi:hypothetical protein LINPERHAP1_LOCUS8421, partial [Linum perenne]